MPFQALLVRLLSLPAGQDLYVTRPNGEYVGMVVAADIMDERLEPVRESAALAEVAARFARTDMERLPVVDGRGVLVGSVSKRDLMSHGRF